MPATARGVYHNLKESKYAISNLEVAFFFSSKLYRKKFLENYKENRVKFKRRIGEFCDATLNYNMLADIELYKKIEKRGFRAVMQGTTIDEETLYKYSARKMISQMNYEWQLLDNKVRG